MNIKTLVVDDSAVMRKIIVRTLNAIGVSAIIEAGDGNEAMKQINERSMGFFDLILSDWNMPDKSGLDFLKEVRATGSKVPFVMITTEAEKTRVIEAVQHGVSDYVVKPFDPDTLRNKIMKFVKSEVSA